MLREYCVFLLLVFAESKQLPKYLQDLRCKRDDNFEKCVLENAKKAIPLLINGDPEFNFPSLNPFKLTSVTLIDTPNLKLKATDLEIYGLADTELAEIRLNTKDHVFVEHFKNKNITVVGNYDINGKIMVMPIVGKGPFSISIINGKLKVSTVAEVVNKDGDDYYNPVDIRLEYLFDNVVFHFENLFEGDKVLGDQMNKFMNENWDVIMLDIGPGVSEVISDIIKKVFMEVAGDVPIKDVFLE